jgi:hypothetical protein
MLVALVLACRGPGRLSESEFRLKANGACSAMKEKANSVDTATPLGFAAGMRMLETGVAQLERLRPPASAAATYVDFLANLKRTVALIRRDQPELVKLTNRVTASLPRRISTYGPSPFKNSRYRALLRRENQLVRQILVPARVAARDATKLGLNKCASGLA